MKILLDEGLPRGAAAFLRDEGIDAVHFTEMGDPSTADVSILEIAGPKAASSSLSMPISMRCLL